MAVRSKSVNTLCVNVKMISVWRLKQNEEMGEIEESIEFIDCFGFRKILL